MQSPPADLSPNKNVMHQRGKKGKKREKVKLGFRRITVVHKSQKESVKETLKTNVIPRRGFNNLISPLCENEKEDCPASRFSLSNFRQINIFLISAFAAGRIAGAPVGSGQSWPRSLCGFFQLLMKKRSVLMQSEKSPPGTCRVCESRGVNCCTEKRSLRNEN